MALDPQYVAMPPITEQIWDKDLNVPLAAGTVQFWRDSDHDTPKEVYELTGSGGSYTYVSLGTELTLSGIGTFVDDSGNNIIPYLWPYFGDPVTSPSDIVDLYYIVVTSSTGVFQFSVNAWPPQLQGGGAPINTSGTTDNIISNSQFVNVLFIPSATKLSPYTFTTTGTGTITEIAPDWSVITNGSGSFSVYQQAITDTAAVTNPPYALGITATGYSSPIQLRQRLYTPRIFSSNYVSGSFIAEAEDGGAYTLTMSYVPSATGTPQTICSGTTPATGFISIYNLMAVEITPPNTGAAPSAYVDIIITIPVGAPIQISSIQLCGVESSDELVAYLQNTPEQEINGLFHYYQPQLNFKPISSYLVGWDFPLNPAQFGLSGSMGARGANTSAYLVDQTIGFQSTTNSISYSFYTNSALLITTTATTQFALIQYLSLPEIVEIFNNQLSVNLHLGAGNNVTLTTTCTVSLWYCTNATLPSLGSNNSIVATLDANGKPATFHGTWTEIPRGVLGNATFSVTNTSYYAFNDYSFSGWEVADLDDAINNAYYFAIVVGFASINSGSTLGFNSISLVPGNIPTRPAPKTYEETLKECQYYYEMSYKSAAVAETAVTENAQYVPQNSLSLTGSTSCALYATPFTLNFLVPKRIEPQLYIYDTTAGTVASVTAILYYANGSNVFDSVGPTLKTLSSYWATPTALSGTLGTQTAQFEPNTASDIIDTDSSSSTVPFSSGGIQFQYVCDSRLGVV